MVVDDLLDPPDAVDIHVPEDARQGRRVHALRFGDHLGILDVHHYSVKTIPVRFHHFQAAVDERGRIEYRLVRFVETVAVFRRLSGAGADGLPLLPGEIFLLRHALLVVGGRFGGRAYDLDDLDLSVFAVITQAEHVAVAVDVPFVEVVYGSARRVDLRDVVDPDELRLHDFVKADSSISSMSSENCTAM
jgi:hypothetical protein